MPTAAQIEKTLKKLGTAERARACARYFKTGEGQYGYGDIFVGVDSAGGKQIAKEYKNLSREETGKLLKNKIHECRVVALRILILQYENGDARSRARIAKFYLAHTKYINNWDLVDLSAPKILGDYLRSRNRKILYKFAKSKNMWERRIAVLATFVFIKDGDYTDTLKLSEMLLGDTHDLMHKAIGWALREVGKKSRPELLRFLNAYKAKMPRTALRYAIERFSPAERKHFLAR